MEDSNYKIIRDMSAIHRCTWVQTRLLKFNKLLYYRYFWSNLFRWRAPSFYQKELPYIEIWWHFCGCLEGISGSCLKCVWRVSGKSQKNLSPPMIKICMDIGQVWWGLECVTWQFPHCFISASGIFIWLQKMFQNVL